MIYYGTVGAIEIICEKKYAKPSLNHSLIWSEVDTSQNFNLSTFRFITSNTKLCTNVIPFRIWADWQDTFPESTRHKHD